MGQDVSRIKNKIDFLYCSNYWLVCATRNLRGSIFVSNCNTSVRSRRNGLIIDLCQWSMDLKCNFEQFLSVQIAESWTRHKIINMIKSQHNTVMTPRLPSQRHKHYNHETTSNLFVHRTLVRLLPGLDYGLILQLFNLMKILWSQHHFSEWNLFKKMYRKHSRCKNSMFRLKIAHGCSNWFELITYPFDS